MFKYHESLRETWQGVGPEEKEALAAKIHALECVLFGYSWEKNLDGSQTFTLRGDDSDAMFGIEAYADTLRNDLEHRVLLGLDDDAAARWQIQEAVQAMAQFRHWQITWGDYSNGGGI